MEEVISTHIGGFGESNSITFHGPNTVRMETATNGPDLLRPGPLDRAVPSL